MRGSAPGEGGVEPACSGLRVRVPPRDSRGTGHCREVGVWFVCFFFLKGPSFYRLVVWLGFFFLLLMKRGQVAGLT